MNKVVKYLLLCLLALAIILGLVFGLKSCKPASNVEPEAEVSDKVGEVDALIEALPAEITLENVDLVDKAKEAFDALSADERGKIKDYDKLARALEVAELLRGGEIDFDSIKNMLTDFNGLNLSEIEKPELINKVVELRNKINLLPADLRGQIPAADLEKLNNAELQLENDGDYINGLLKGIQFPLTDANLNFASRLKSLIVKLSPEELAKVDNGLIDKLNAEIDAKSSDASLLGGIDEEKIKAVEDLIANIKAPVTLDIEEDIRKAADAFNALSADEKAKVGNSDLLKSYVDSLRELKNNANSSNEQPENAGNEAKVETAPVAEAPAVTEAPVASIPTTGVE